jgi:hypothetical protein
MSTTEQMDNPCETPAREKVPGYTGTGLFAPGFITIAMAILFPAIMH